MTPSISVIIPFYNSQDTLQRCVESVKRQLLASDELILVNDGSTDSSLEIARSFGGVLIEFKNNRGPSTARNAGAEVAKGEVFVFLDSDIELAGEELKKVREIFSKSSDINSITGTLDPKYGPHNFFTDYKNIYMNYIFSKFKDEVSFVYGSFCAIKASSFFPWPTSPRLGEDSHWGYLQVKRGMKIHLVKSIAVRHMKKYSLGSLAHNDFRIALNFTMLFLRYRRWNTLYTQEDFGHTSKNQKLSLLMACLAVTASLFSMKLLLGFLLIWFFLNFNFLKIFFDYRGAYFFICAVAWTFVDHLIYSAGVVIGISLYPGSSDA